MERKLLLAVTIIVFVAVMTVGGLLEVNKHYNEKMAKAAAYDLQMLKSIDPLVNITSKDFRFFYQNFYDPNNKRMIVIQNGKFVVLKNEAEIDLAHKIDDVQGTIKGIRAQAVEDSTEAANNRKMKP